MSSVLAQSRPLGRFVRAIVRRSFLRRAVMSIRHRGLRSSDVFIGSYPRSGNTWLRSMIWSCLMGEAMEEFRGAENEILPYIGFHQKAACVLAGEGRLIKTHEPWRPEYQRAIWVLRDPRDVCVSEHRLSQRARLFRGSLDNFVQQFLEHSPFGSANWEQHALSWADSSIAQTSNMLSLRFEDLKSDPHRNLKQVLEFLRLPHSDEGIAVAISQNSVESMAARHAAYDKSLKDPHRASIPAINKGNAGGWQNSLSVESVERIQAAFGETMRRLGYSISTEG